MKKLLLLLISILLIANLAQYLYTKKTYEELLEVGRLNSAQLISNELLALSGHIKKMEKQNWSNSDLNQEVFERMDDIRHTTTYLININQHIKGFPIRENKKINEISEVLEEKYRGREANYEERVLTSQIKGSLINLSSNIDTAFSKNSQLPIMDWDTFMKSLDGLIMLETK